MPCQVTLARVDGQALAEILILVLPIVADWHRRVSACVRIQVVDCGYLT